jgi:hypothetical protein
MWKYPIVFSIICAWILWTLERDFSYLPSKGFDDQVSCEKALKQLAGDSQEAQETRLLLCLPDTVDPRSRR